VLDYAFQPVIHVHGGMCLGYEALMRGVGGAGFPSIFALLDQAFEDGVLYALDLALREKAFTKYRSLPGAEGALVFFNLDNRILETPGYSSGNTLQILKRIGLTPDAVCFEVSERHGFRSYPQMRGLLEVYQKQGFKIALDDYGSGFAGLELLYHLEPEFIKIAPLLIGGVGSDAKKRLLISNLVTMAHTLGCRVIAEGVEIEEDFLMCRRLGCDLVQGYYVERPQEDSRRLKREYSLVAPPQPSIRMRGSMEEELVRAQVEAIPPVSISRGVATVFEAFLKNCNLMQIPLVDMSYHPVGVILERHIKPYAYSAYGKELLQNSAFGKPLTHFLTRCPTAEMDLAIDRLLETFSLADDAPGVVMTRSGRYVGFLSANSLLRLLNERNIRVARDQNPLTRLPGNPVIHEYLADALSDPSSSYLFAYFDLDDFKCFNDRYGFRHGDRAIILFADILQAAAHGRNLFVGHIGGDDFFAGACMDDRADLQLLESFQAIQAQFRRDVVSLYHPEDRAAGQIRAKGRDGTERSYPLLTVSAAVLHLPWGRSGLSVEDLGEIAAAAKHEAKGSPGRFSYRDLCAPKEDALAALPHAAPV
jgi:EAL domain-containing protein (putative c-di-GMP-specific phosphodiesterase class I)/GGDEF domain-containing protein